MTLVPLTECCLHLGIDPKTLRLWLKTAHLVCCTHPADARLKCLTHDQLVHLARCHDRPLLGEAALSPAPALPALAFSPSIPSPAALTSSEVAELRQQMTLLQAQLATLQAQVTELALTLLRAGTGALPSPQRSAPLPPPAPSPSPRAPRRAPTASPTTSATTEPPRPRSRALPLIEARDDGSYVIISPTEGVLPLLPDSPQWFSWLASLTGFSFQGQHGSFSATRKFRNGERIQSWNLHRSLHGRSCTLYLGLTSTLTLARLENMAATTHARLTHL